MAEGTASVEARLTASVHVKAWAWLFGLLLLAVALVVVLTVRDYGVTWDEENHRIYGDAVVDWYTSFFSNRDAVDKWRLFIYGGFFDALAQLAARFSHQGVYETRHAVGVLFGVLGIVVAYRIGSRLAGQAGGFFSALFLTLTPVYYGHMFNNPKDAPLATMFLLSLSCLLDAHDRLPHVPKRQIVILGTVIGLTAGIRVVGILIVGYMALLWCAWLVGSHRLRSIPPSSSLFRSATGLLLSLLSTAVIAWGVMVLCWPWAQTAPLSNPVSTLFTMTDFDWPKTVLYKGFNIEAGQLPPSYLPTWVAISMPEFYFVAGLAGLALVLRGCLRSSWLLAHWHRASQIGLLAFAASAPIIAQIALHSTVYDGLRQFLFVVPPMAVLAGVAVASLLQSRAASTIKLLLGGAVLFSVVLTVRDMAALHPYEYIYFNRLVAGGFQSAATRFETDYYGASYREGVLWLINNYHPQTTEKIRVCNPSKPFLTGYYLEASEELRSRFVNVPDGDNPNVYLAITRWNKHREPGTVLHVVTREGVPLLYIIEQRKPS